MTIERVVFHLGLHKTGTTSVQNAFDRARAQLAELGAHYIPLEHARRSLTALLIRPHEKERAEARAVFAAMPQRCLLLSDENIIGGLADPLAGQLYPQAEPRIRSLTQILPDAEVHVVIVLRSPQSFFPALYSEYLRHGTFVRFQDYVAGLDLKDFGFRKHFQFAADAGIKAHWHFLPFEADLGGGVPAAYDLLAKLLVGADAPKLGPFPDLRMRASLTAEEMALVADAGEQMGGSMATAVTRLLASRDTRLGTTPFRPMDASLAEELAARYREDVSWLMRIG